MKNYRSMPAVISIHIRNAMVLIVTGVMLNGQVQVSTEDFAQKLGDGLEEASKAEVLELRLSQRAIRRLEASLNVNDEDDSDAEPKIRVVALTYEFRSDNEKGDIGICLYESVDEAIAWMKRRVLLMPVSPAEKPADLGDEAFRFGARTGIETGSLFFRRGPVLVQVNAKTRDNALRIARMIDAAAKKDLGK